MTLQLDSTMKRRSRRRIPHQVPKVPDEPSELQRLMREFDAALALADKPENSRDREIQRFKAIAAACRFLSELARQIEDLIKRTLEASGIEPGAETSVRLRDVTATHPHLEVFRSREELVGFVASCSVILKDAGMSSEKVQHLLQEITQQYELLRDQPLNTTQLREKFEMLRKLFCGGGPDDDDPDGGPKGGKPGPWKRWVRPGLTLLAEIATILSFIGMIAGGTPQPAPQSPPVPQEIRMRLALLSVLMLAALYDAFRPDGPAHPPDRPQGMGPLPVDWIEGATIKVIPAGSEAGRKTPASAYA
jgi:hypothetical protein